MLNHSTLAADQELIYQHMQPTACLAWPLLCQAFGRQLWLKHENQTPIGAFKVRGGLVYLHELDQSSDTAPIVTATRGNHGQSIPFAASRYGRPVRVYVPEGNSREKNAAMTAWGAEVVIQGRDFDIAREAAEHDAQTNGSHLVPSFHEHLVRGVATYGAELFSQAGDLHTVYVPIGMGSGAASLVLIRDLLGLKTHIVGVVSAHADAMALSLESGRIVETNSAYTFADGVATRVPHPHAFEILSQGLERVVRVSDDEVAEAIRLLYRTTHQVAEGAGAAATAAAMQERDRYADDQSVAVILTGSNIDTEWFVEVMAGRTPSVL